MRADPFRPPVNELFFHLFGRPIHPELLDTLAVRQVQRDDYTLTVRITPMGHVLHWQTQETHLCEVTATATQPLPSSGHLLHHRVRGGHSGRCRAWATISYQVCSQVEVLPPEVFQQIHEDLIHDGPRRGLLYQFRDAPWGTLAPLGLVVVEALRECISVATFHTFPAEWTLVKTQSLIERKR